MPVGGNTWIRGDRVSEGMLYCAVDVGTSRTSAAIAGIEASGVVVRPVRLGQNGDAASSAVFVTDDEFLHGDIAERRGVGEPARLLRDYKRRIGDDVPLTVAGRSISPEEVYARTVEWAVATACPDPAGLTVTVPASWGPHRRGLVRAAIVARGLPDPTLLSEPEAAAQHYAARHDAEPAGVLAVYDLGAGTFDLAFVRTGEGGATVLHATGIDDVGGADFDDAVIDHVLASVGPVAAAGTPVTLATLRRECVAAKEALSFDGEAAIPVLIDGTGGTVRLVRSEFEAMVEHDIARTVHAFEAARDAAGLAPGDVSAVLLSGGSSRIPRVAQLLSEQLDLDVRMDADPKAVVALGAARAGAAAAAAVSAAALAPAEPDDLAAWLASLETTETAGAVATAGAPTPVAITAGTETPSRLAPALLALHPRRWRMAMTGTAAAATLVGGLAFGSSVATAHGVLPTSAPVAADAGDETGESPAYAGVLSGGTAPADAEDAAARGDDPAPDDDTAPPAAEPDPPGRIPLAPVLDPENPPALPPSPVDRLQQHAAEVIEADAVKKLPSQQASPADRPREASAPAPRTSSTPRPSTSSAPPKATSSPSPHPSPSHSVAAPSPSTAPDPAPTTAPEPSATPDPTPTTQPDPEPTTDPTPDPTPTSDPTPDPTPTSDPPPEPTPDPSPTSEPPASPGPEPETSTAH